MHATSILGTVVAVASLVAAAPSVTAKKHLCSHLHSNISHDAEYHHNVIMPQFLNTVADSPNFEITPRGTAHYTGPPIDVVVTCIFKNTDYRNFGDPVCKNDELKRMINEFNKYTASVGIPFKLISKANKEIPEDYFGNESHIDDDKAFNLVKNTLDSHISDRKRVLHIVYLPIGSHTWGVWDDEIGAVILSNTQLPNYIFPKYSNNARGDLLWHEIGHWMGLHHPFDGGCSGNDYVPDVPQGKDENRICWGNPNDAPDACGGKTALNPSGKIDYKNIMDYTEDNCRDHFTDGQLQKALKFLHSYRGLGGGASPSTEQGNQKRSNPHIERPYESVDVGKKTGGGRPYESVDAGKYSGGGRPYASVDVGKKTGGGRPYESVDAGKYTGDGRPYESVDE